jgi:hypothetical protein
LNGIQDAMFHWGILEPLLSTTFHPAGTTKRLLTLKSHNLLLKIHIFVLVGPMTESFYYISKHVWHVPTFVMTMLLGTVIARNSSFLPTYSFVRFGSWLPRSPLLTTTSWIDFELKGRNVIVSKYFFLKANVKIFEYLLFNIWNHMIF